jgi:hypothetical protein
VSVSPELDHLLRELEPASPANLGLRLKFGLLCVERVAHLMEQPEALACLESFKEVVSRDNLAELPALAASAERVANHHQGSKSLDGVGHAAVSATYACAKAISGKARQAAEYAAYAAVYGQGGYGATSDPSSFMPEHHWQAEQLDCLLTATRRRASAA